MDEIKLELMDWKNIEREAEEGIRQAKLNMSMHDLARHEAKKMIKSFGGKTSEEERVNSKKKIAESLEATSAENDKPL